MNGKADKNVLVELSRKLEHIVSRKDGQTSNQVKDILKILQSIEVDPLLLREVKIILTVYNLRKNIDHKEVIQLSKRLLKSWSKSFRTETNEIRDLIVNGFSEKTSRLELRLKFTDAFNKILRKDTVDQIRIKSRELLAKALMSDQNVDQDLLLIAQLAKNIEQSIFKEFNNTDTKYKARIRSRISNLSDEKNIQLRGQVLRGKISAEVVAKVTTEELATDKMKKLREKFHKQVLSDNQLPEVFGTTTELLKCPECKKNYCTYNQVQIDRADEPMTTFCLCISCGHRWKFN